MFSDKGRPKTKKLSGVWPWQIRTALVLAIVLVGGLALTTLTAREQEENNRMETIVKASPDQARAVETHGALLHNFYLSDYNLYREHFEIKSDDKAFSYLWPYSGVISALNALARLPGAQQSQYRAELVRVLDGLEQYFDPNAPIPGYDSYVRNYGGGQKFYDDNEWLGLDFLEAYHTLGDPKYLEKAKITFRFAISGWSSEMGGGIYWRENDPETKNTCSNGPAALLALKLYQATGEAEYLDWAKKILDWVRQLKSPDSGVYWDSLNRNGTIDKRTFTYNVGTPLHAYALLYKISGDQRYLQEAKALAQASLEHFAQPHAVAGGNFYPDTPWFNAVLFKGYLALYEADPTHDLRYIEAMRQNLNYAWEHARDEKGLFAPDWTGTTGLSSQHKWLLDQAPMVELYALVAQFSQVKR